MQRHRKKRHKPYKLRASDSSKKTSKGEKKSIAATTAGWRGRHPVFMFLFVFTALMGLFYAFALFTPFYEQHFPRYLGFNARLSGHILAFLGQDVTVRDKSISSPVFSVTIKQGCDAIEPTALFVCAVLAFPGIISKKIVGVITGTLILALLNLIRIVTLFLVGVYLPRAFELMHIEVWQGLFIFIAILLWVFWLLWTGKTQVPEQNSQS